MPTIHLPQHHKAQASGVQRPRSRRNLLLYVAVVLVFSWTAYMLLGTTSEPDMSTDTNGKEGQYGLNARPGFKDLIQVQDLDSALLPQTGKHRHPGRLIIVGDVHGMKDALLDLLAKVDFNEKHDHLILAGDMVSKGPDSPGVVDLAMKLGASGVRGNHEDRILLVHEDMIAEHVDMSTPGPDEDRDKKEDLLEEQSFSHGDYKDRALVRALGEERLKWLKKCPVILRVGQLGDMGEVVVVHAGLAPGVKFEKQDPFMVMNMRTISKEGVPSDEREGVAWIQIWNKHQKKLPKKDRTTVIYGHDSKRGLQVEKYSMGIDTGCLKGGKLSTVVIEGGNSSPSHKIVHVGCKDGRPK